jgi:hypothetical protein
MPAPSSGGGVGELGESVLGEGVEDVVLRRMCRWQFRPSLLSLIPISIDAHC